MGKSIPTTTSLKQAPDDPAFWEAEREALYILLLPFIREAVETAAMNAYTELAGYVDLGIAWDLINPNVSAWASQYTAQVVSQISQTSMAGFLEQFEPWMQSGDPLQSLINALEPYYGPVRAEMIAVTETTRAYAQGNLAVWQATGMVEGYNFMTAEDDLVCPLCDGRDGAASRNPHSLNDYEDMPPRHVRCRCWIQPVVNLVDTL